VQALEGLGIINQPIASIAKKEEILYVYGRESEPVRLDRHSPVLHLVQQIRDESHRFAVAFHRARRGTRQMRSELLAVPGIGERTVRRLLQEFGSLENVRLSSEKELQRVLNRRQAAALREFLSSEETPATPTRIE
jgi:excinuclease ABC subunit C